jgi:Ser/Thr protein kinase RdoA (MazF antagonist)
MTPPLSYAALDPLVVLQALDAVGLHGDGRLLQLNSYENRVFQVHLDDGSAVVVKFYRPARWSDEQIVEEHDYALELAAADVPVVAPRTLQSAESGVTFSGAAATLAHASFAGHAWRYTVSDRHGGRAPELEDPAVLQWLGRFLGRLHAVGRQSRFEHRRTLDVTTFGWQARERVLRDADPDTLGGWPSVCEQALGIAEQRFATVPAPPLRLHGDCHPGNILWRDEGPHIVDLDDAVNGPAVQDFWMLVSGDRDTMARQLAALLAGYRVFMPFDERQLALIEPLRTLRMVHHSAWIAERWSDPAFPAAFPWFGTPAYWQQQTMQLREQIDAMVS